MSLHTENLRYFPLAWPRLVQSTYETIKSCTHIALCSSLYCTTVRPFSFPCVCTNSDKYFVAGTELEMLIYMGPGLSGTLDQMMSRGPFQPKLCSDLCVCVCQCALNEMRNGIIFIGKMALHKAKVGIPQCESHAQPTRIAWFI